MGSDCCALPVIETSSTIDRFEKQNIVFKQLEFLNTQQKRFKTPNIYNVL